MKNCLMMPAYHLTATRLAWGRRLSSRRLLTAVEAAAAVAQVAAYYWTRSCWSQSQGPPGPYVSWSALEIQNGANVPDIGCIIQRRCDQHPQPTKAQQPLGIFRKLPSRAKNQ